MKNYSNKIIFLLIFLFGVFGLAKSSLANTYTTNFSLTENPISEGGNWINGGATGLDWFNVMTDGTHAHGVNTTGSYTDPTAIVSGNWGPNQTVSATVYNPETYTSNYPEVELRLRSSISAHSITGYEVNMSVNKNNHYLQLVRWNGPMANFTYLTTSGPGGYVVTGDELKATITEYTITVYINNVEVMRATDTDVAKRFSSGSPGIGFDYGCNGGYSQFGFSSFTATDGLSADAIPPAAPSGLSVS